MTTLKLGSRGEDVKTLQSILGGLTIDGIFGAKTEVAVKNFQKSNNLVIDGIVGNKTWEKLLNTTSSNDVQIKKSTRKITEIFVHCSATPEGKDFTTKDIKAWHLQRGFTDIGYHYVIYRDGSINLGRDVNKVGAHVTGHNSYSIGICYIGGMDSANKNPKDTRTDEQKKSLLKLLKGLRKLYPVAKIYGHRDFANKACPSFDAKKEYSNI